MKLPYQQQQHHHHHHHHHNEDNDDNQNFEMIDNLSAALLPIPRRSSLLIEAIDEASFYIDTTWKKTAENGHDDDDDDDWDNNDDDRDDEYDDVKLRQQQEQRHREHMKSTLALCTSLFTMFFLLSSLFPYSGFMVMELIQNGNDGNNNNNNNNNSTATITKETVGVYAGLLTSAFMIGRALSAVIWGQIGDVYGRKFCLYVGCISSAIGSLAFGLCTSSFRTAFIIRFFMGLFNGTMVMARTVITELAHGDKSLESKGVGLLMSMIGYGTLVAPVIGGCLSQPIMNYPQLVDWDFLPRYVVTILEMYPFLLPNLVGCILSIMTFVLTAMYVPETLPQDKLRHWSNAGRDILDWFIRHYFVFCWKLSPRNKKQYVDDPSQDEHSGGVWVSQSRQHNNKDDASLPQSYASETTSLLDYSETSDDDDDDDAEKISGVNDSYDDDNSQRSQQADSGIIWKQSSQLIQVILTYWFYTLVSVAQAECFPLFAMSTIGGLAMNTSSIGLVGTLAGCVYVFGQYVTFQFAIHNFGTLRTMQFGSFVAGTIVIAYPFGRFFLLSPTTQIVAMGLVMGIDMVAGSVFMGANTIEVNKLVTDPSQRGKINGITSMGTSIGRALGPIIAGSLTTYFMNPTTYKNHPELATSGGWFVYGILLVIGIIAFLPTLLIEDEDDDDRQNLQQECAELEELEV